MEKDDILQEFKYESYIFQEMERNGTGIPGNRSWIPGGTENMPGCCSTEFVTAAFKMKGCFDDLEFIISMCANVNLEIYTLIPSMYKLNTICAVYILNATTVVWICDVLLCL